MKPPDKDPAIADEGISLEGNSPVVAPSDGNSPESPRKLAQPPSSDTPAEKPSDKPKLITRVLGYLKHLNVYFLGFLLMVCLAVVIAVVAISKSNKNPTGQNSNQSLSAKQLEQLANSAPTIGSANQTLNIAANTIFSGDVLARKNVDVAGILTADSLNLSQLNVSGAVDSAQDSTGKLSVNGNATIAGPESISGILSVAGASSFGGALSANQINVQNLQLSGNLTVNKHILATGASPAQSVGSAVGGGGTASDSGNDTTGTININTGSSPPAGCFITLTFSQPFSTTPHAVVTPVNGAAGGLQFYVTRSTTSMSLCTDSAAPSNASFSFDYVILG
jgi:hypothetical protein